jgi:hypothetical protein
MKTFEQYSNDEPTIGEYILAVEKIDAFIEKSDAVEIETFISENIGTLFAINTDGKIKLFIVQYENVPEHLKSYFYLNRRTFYIQEIVFHCETKEEVEIKMQANKFNL